MGSKPRPPMVTLRRPEEWWEALYRQMASQWVDEHKPQLRELSRWLRRFR